MKDVRFVNDKGVESFTKLKIPVKPQTKRIGITFFFGKSDFKVEVFDMSNQNQKLTNFELEFVVNDLKLN